LCRICLWLIALIYASLFLSSSEIGGWYIDRCIGRPLDLARYALSRHMEIKFDNWHTWTWSSIYAENNKSKMPKHALRWVHGFDGRGLNLGGAGRVATGVPASWPPSRVSAGQGRPAAYSNSDSM
jgi:hypothetical protein